MKTLRFLPLLLLCTGALLHGQPTPAVGGLQARHHEGQTILTWTEAATVAATIPEAMTMNEARALRATHQVTSYRVYRATTPIASVAGLVPLKTVSVLSGWNTELDRKSVV